MLRFPSYWFSWLSGASTVWRILAEDLRGQGHTDWAAKVEDIAEMFEERALLLLVVTPPVIKVAEP